MIRLIIALVFLFVVFFLGIRAVREKTADPLGILETIAYSLLCSLLTLFSLVLIVVLF
jgi:predicted secreted protein